MQDKYVTVRFLHLGSTWGPSLSIMRRVRLTYRESEAPQGERHSPTLWGNLRCGPVSTDVQGPNNLPLGGPINKQCKMRTIVTHEDI